MATSKPGVMTYLGSTTYQQLVEFKEKQKLRSLSHAVEVILEAYFESVSSNTNIINYKLLKQQELLTENLSRLADSCDTLCQGIISQHSSNLKLNQSSFAIGLANASQDPLTQKSSHFCLGTDEANKIILTPEIINHGLKGVALAARLNVCSSSLSKKRSKPDFHLWSQRLDPNDIAWEYRSVTRHFHPLVSVIQP